MTRNEPSTQAYPATPQAAEPAPEEALDLAITHALQRAPSVAVPERFAAEVTHRAISPPRSRRGQGLGWASASVLKRSLNRGSRLGWGPGLTLGSAVLLTAAMFALAPHAAPSLHNTRFDAELVLLAELSGLLLFSTRLLPRD